VNNGEKGNIRKGKYMYLNGDKGENKTMTGNQKTEIERLKAQETLLNFFFCRNTGLLYGR